MGGIFEAILPSKPKQPQIQYVDNSEELAKEAEQKRRSQRSGYSNVNTSYRGLLGGAQDLPKRKTLLGE